MKKRIVLFSAAFLVASFTVRAQSSAGGAGMQNGSAGTQSTATAGATVTYAPAETVNSTSNFPRQYLGAAPGLYSAPGPFPGLPGQNSPFNQIAPTGLKTIPMEVLDSKAARQYAGKVETYVRYKDTEPLSANGILVMRYNPEATPPPELAALVAGDQLLGKAEVRTKPFKLDDPYMLSAIRKLADGTNCKRVAIYAQVINTNHTHASGWGVGGTGGHASGENTTSGLALGYSRGNSDTEQRPSILYVIEGYNYNNGLVELPPVQQKQAQALPAPASPSAPQAQLSLPAEIRVHLDPLEVKLPQALVDALQARSSAPSLLPPPPPSQMTATVVEACKVPPLESYFDFNKYDIKPQDDRQIKSFAEWIVAHPMCTLIVVGHTDRVGTNRYNDHLGNQRAEAVYDRLIVYGAPKQHMQFASPGKRFPQGEYNQKNRRVVIEAISSTSGR